MEKSPDAFRTISEVAEVLDTPAHVLRFWESRFAQVRPVKRAGGRRYYRPTDVALLAGIRVLLHDQGITIRGVQKILREQGVRQVAQIGASALSGQPVPALAVPDDDRVPAGAGSADPAGPGADGAGSAAPDDPGEAGDLPAPSEARPPEPAPRARRAPASAGGAAIHDLFSRAASTSGAASAAADPAPAADRPVPPDRGGAGATGLAAHPGAVQAETTDSAGEGADRRSQAGEPEPLAVRLRALPPAVLARHAGTLVPLAVRLAALRRRMDAGARG